MSSNERWLTGRNCLYARKLRMVSENYKICSVYMMAHNSMLDVQAKQAKAKQAQSNNG